MARLTITFRVRFKRRHRAAFAALRLVAVWSGLLAPFWCRKRLCESTLWHVLLMCIAEDVSRAAVKGARFDPAP